MSEPAADERLELSLGQLLRAGVIVSGLIVAVGGTTYLWHHGAETPDHRTFHAEPAEYRNAVDIMRAALAGTGRGVIALGLLLLIATPIARVVFSAVAFARQRDWTYLALTLFVLAVLLWGLLSG